MPVSFEQPAPVEMNVYAQAAGLQQQQKQYELLQHQQALQLQAQNASFEQAMQAQNAGQRSYEFEASRQTSPRDVWAADQQEQHADSQMNRQMQLQQVQLTQAEQMRLQKLQAAKSAIQEKIDDHTLTPEDGANLLFMADTGIDPLQRRHAQAQLQQQELGIQHTRDTMRRATEDETRLRTWREQNANGELARLANPDILRAVTQNIREQNPIIAQMAEAGGPIGQGAADDMQRMIDAEMDRRGGYAYGSRDINNSFVYHPEANRGHIEQQRLSDRQDAFRLHAMTHIFDSVQRRATAGEIAFTQLPSTASAAERNQQRRIDIRNAAQEEINQQLQVLGLPANTLNLEQTRSADAGIARIAALASAGARPTPAPAPEVSTTGVNPAVEHPAAAPAQNPYSQYSNWVQGVPTPAPQVAPVENSISIGNLNQIIGMVRQLGDETSSDREALQLLELRRTRQWTPAERALFRGAYERRRRDTSVNGQALATAMSHVLER